MAFKAFGRNCGVLEVDQLDGALCRGQADEEDAEVGAADVDGEELARFVAVNEGKRGWRGWMESDEVEASQGQRPCENECSLAAASCTLLLSSPTHPVGSRSTMEGSIMREEGRPSKPALAC